MEFDAIVYTSKHGHTRQYAEMLAQVTKLPMFPLEEAKNALPKGSRVLYLGWLHASHLQGYREAAALFTVPVACGVGLCDTGTLKAEVRKATNIPEHVLLFTLQGGMNRSELQGMDKLLISMLTKGMESKKNKTKDDERMLQLLKSDSNYVRLENLNELLQVIGTDK